MFSSSILADGEGRGPQAFTGLHSGLESRTNQTISGSGEENCESSSGRADSTVMRHLPLLEDAMWPGGEFIVPCHL